MLRYWWGLGGACVKHWVGLEAWLSDMGGAEVGHVWGCDEGMGAQPAIKGETLEHRPAHKLFHTHIHTLAPHRGTRPRFDKTSTLPPCLASQPPARSLPPGLALLCYAR